MFWSSATADRHRFAQCGVPSLPGYARLSVRSRTSISRCSSAPCNVNLTAPSSPACGFAHMKQRRCDRSSSPTRSRRCAPRPCPCTRTTPPRRRGASRAALAAELGRFTFCQRHRALPFVPHGGRPDARSRAQAKFSRDVRSAASPRSEEIKGLALFLSRPASSYVPGACSDRRGDGSVKRGLAAFCTGRLRPLDLRAPGAPMAEIASEVAAELGARLCRPAGRSREVVPHDAAALRPRVRHKVGPDVA